LGERWLCKPEVGGSSPPTSTSSVSLTAKIGCILVNPHSASSKTQVVMRINQT
jgi:hypothetical protein